MNVKYKGKGEEAIKGRKIPKEAKTDIDFPVDIK